MSNTEALETLKKHVLVDGFHIVVDHQNSFGSHVVDLRTGKKYIDCYSSPTGNGPRWTS